MVPQQTCCLPPARAAPPESVSIHDSQLTSGECGIRFTFVFYLFVQAQNMSETLPKITRLEDYPKVPAMWGKDSL